LNSTIVAPVGALKTKDENIPIITDNSDINTENMIMDLKLRAI